jgi:hypothetical protein
VPAVLTVILVPVAALLQTIVPVQPVAVNVAVSVPQRLILLVLTDGGFEPAPIVITIALEFPLSPQLLLHVAVYVPALLTLIVAVVAPLLHLTVPPQPVALNVAFSVPQILVLFEEIVGGTGNVPVTIVTILLAPLSPQLLIHTAE